MTKQDDLLLMLHNRGGCIGGHELSIRQRQAVAKGPEARGFVKWVSPGIHAEGNRRDLTLCKLVLTDPGRAKLVVSGLIKPSAADTEQEQSHG